MLLRSNLRNERAPAGATNRGALVVIAALLRLVAWLLAVAVTFVTLGPQDVRPHPVLGQQGDHALAFLLIGIFFGLAYSQRRWTVSAVAIALIGLLEITQLWVPDQVSEVFGLRYFGSTRGYLRRRFASLNWASPG